MKRVIAATGLAVMLAVPVANAAVSDEDFAAVKQMLEEALNRIGELEKQQASGQAPTAETATQVAANTAAIEKMSWAERIKLQGDFRYRYQHGEFNDPATAANGDILDGSRNRNRIRARAAIVATLPEDFEVGLGIASGGDDPVSTNQTLGGGGSTKDINLDMAYFDWTGLENTSIRGGKFKRKLKVVGKSAMQWDSDWRPEGMSVVWDNDTFFAQGLATYLESDSDKDSEFAYILQTGAQAELAGIKLLGGVGYTDIDAEGSECFFEGDDFGQCFGNEAITNGSGDLVYANDFEVYNVFGSATFDFAGMPVSVFGDWIKNDAADDYDSGFLVGAQLGKLKKKGSWQAKAYFEELQANATIGLLSNSDFGVGGTNGKGFVVSGGYGITDQVAAKFTYYAIENNSDNIPAYNGGEEFDTEVLQLDLTFKYK